MNYKKPKNITLNKIKSFFYKKNLKILINENQKQIEKEDIFSKIPYKPNLQDLFRLYNLITLNKRTTIVEFGTGWSTLVMIAALNENKILFSDTVKHLRRNNPFEIFILENDKKYLNISKKRVINFFKKNSIKNKIKINWIYTNAKMTTFNGHICTQYTKLPLCNPDFIYSDGPAQFGVHGNINNFSTNHKDIVPIGADLLMIEYFLIPGTMILVDGRTANAKFLKDNFKRNWIYERSRKYDQHIFYLNDESLGVLNDKLLRFYKK